MSGKAMEWGARQGFKGLTQLALLRLCFHHNYETGRCDPSIARMATDSGVSGDKLRRCIREIELSGLVERTERKAGKVNETNAYRLRLDLGVQEDGVLANSQGGTLQQPGGYPTAAGGVLANSQANKEENKEENKEIEAASKPVALRKAKVLRMGKTETDLQTPQLPDWIDPEVFADWMVMRRDDKKKPVTTSVAKAAIATLERLRKCGEDPNKVLAHGTLNQWQGLYADKKGETKADPLPQPVTELVGTGYPRLRP